MRNMTKAVQIKIGGLVLNGPTKVNPLFLYVEKSIAI